MLSPLSRLFLACAACDSVDVTFFFFRLIWIRPKGPLCPGCGVRSSPAGFLVSPSITLSPEDLSLPVVSPDRRSSSSSDKLSSFPLVADEGSTISLRDILLALLEPLLTLLLGLEPRTFISNRVDADADPAGIFTFLLELHLRSGGLDAMLAMRATQMPSTSAPLSMALMPKGMSPPYPFPFARCMWW